MEALVQPQQMLIHLACYFTNGLLSYTGKDGIAQFLEHRRSDTGDAIWSTQSLKHGRAGSLLQATIMEPATVQAVPPTATKSMFIESTILLK